MGIYIYIGILILILIYMGLSENGVQTPNEIAIFHRDNDQQNHWVQWGTRHFQTNPSARNWWAQQLYSELGGSVY